MTAAHVFRFEYRKMHGWRNNCMKEDALRKAECRICHIATETQNSLIDMKRNLDKAMEDFCWVTEGYQKFPKKIKLYKDDSLLGLPAPLCHYKGTSIKQTKI